MFAKLGNKNLSPNKEKKRQILPTFLLPIISKVIERIVHDQTIHFSQRVNTRNSFAKFKHPFCKTSTG